MLGGLSAGYVADRFGRRRGLLLVQSFSAAGVALMGACEVAGSYEMLVVGRFLVGLCCGFCTGLSPLYVSEERKRFVKIPLAGFLISDRHDQCQVAIQEVKEESYFSLQSIFRTMSEYQCITWEILYLH